MKPFVKFLIPTAMLALALYACHKPSATEIDVPSAPMKQEQASIFAEGV